MYGKGPKNNPSPGKHSDTALSRAYGDSDLRMLSGELPPVKLGDIELRVLVKEKKYAPKE